jgi:hypothetical protein
MNPKSLQGVLVASSLLHRARGLPCGSPAIKRDGAGTAPGSGLPARVFCAEGGRIRTSDLGFRLRHSVVSRSDQVSPPLLRLLWPLCV